MNFHSSEYQWLVVAGAKAQFKGTGTINGSYGSANTSGYGFILTAIDGKLNAIETACIRTFLENNWMMAYQTLV